MIINTSNSNIVKQNQNLNIFGVRQRFSFRYYVHCLTHCEMSKNTKRFSITNDTKFWWPVKGIAKVSFSHSNIKLMALMVCLHTKFNVHSFVWINPWIYFYCIKQPILMLEGLTVWSIEWNAATYLIDNLLINRWSMIVISLIISIQISINKLFQIS